MAYIVADERSGKTFEKRDQVYATQQEADAELIRRIAAAPNEEERKAREHNLAVVEVDAEVTEHGDDDDDQGDDEQ